MRGSYGYSTSLWIRKKLLEKPNNPYELWKEYKDTYSGKNTRGEQYRIGNFYTFYHMFWLLKKIGLIEIFKVTEPKDREIRIDEHGNEIKRGRHLPIKWYRIVKNKKNSKKWRNPTKAYLENIETKNKKKT